jgi:Zn-dependent M28 family amino/carboxypeptidase
VNGDSIYNGAADNATGTAALLTLAKAYAAMPTPPKRSILFLAVTAEEQGLLGSQYYAEHPTFMPGRIAANFNFDGGNIFGRAEDVVFVGKGKSSLDEVVEKYAQAEGRVVKPDQMPDRGHFYRSDQFNFARIGVPAFYASDSMDFRGRPPGWGKQQVEDFEEHRYHQPSDEYDPAWNLEGMLEDVRLAFYASLEVANADEPPIWRHGDEFEAARIAARAQVGDAEGAPH